MTKARKDRRLAAGDRFSPRELDSVRGERVAVPQPKGLVHLQLRRFAGCPVCNMHLASLRRRHHELTRAGIREIAVFHSTSEDLRKYADDMPFDLVADPEKRLYRELGAEQGVRALLDPRAYAPIARAVAVTSVNYLRHGQPLPPLDPPGGRYGLPAEFLIASDARVVAAKYGQYVDDQWSVDEVLGFALQFTV